ncbi:MAG: MBL fold metallo-hydrolase [Gemmatimonadota bacterium]
MKVTLIAHSTLLISLDGRNVLVDPFFGPSTNPAYKRTVAPALGPADLPDLDLVLITHTHFDHFDRRFIRGLAEGVTVVGPGRSLAMRLRGPRAAVLLKPGDALELDSIRAAATPASHSAPAVGYLLRGREGCVYLAGDTYYRDFMLDLGEAAAIDLAVLPILTFRVPVVMGQRGFLRAVRALTPRFVMPVHRGITPRLPLLRSSPRLDQLTARVAAGSTETSMVVLQAGECWSLGEGVG